MAAFFGIIAWIIGILIISYAIITIIGFTLTLVKANKSAKYEDYEELLPYISSDFESFRERHKDLSEEKCVLTFFSKKSNYLRAKENKKEQEERTNDILYRKPKIQNRVYSYKYENLVYEIFAPYAKLDDHSPLDKPKYTFGYVNNDVVKSEIVRLLKVSAPEADKLFDEFVKNRLLYVSTYQKENGEWCTGKVCTMGSILEYDWDVISKYDMNFTKWKKNNQ